MAAIPNEELIDAAQAVLKPHTVEGRLFGDVASTLVTDRGTRYSGVCIDTASGGASVREPERLTVGAAVMGPH